MPLSRSNTRAQSPSCYPPSPRPPNFLPPSHYAAAGGFSFLSRHAQQSSTESDGVYRPVEAPSSPDIYMPVSQPDSDSSFEFQPRSDKRFTMMSSKNKFNKRESQMVNLPLVETQLLPSLRDTIDKMTRPPSRAATSHTTPSPAQLSVKSFHVDRMLSPSITPSSPRSPRPVTPQPPCPEPIEEPMTPKAKPALKSALRAPTPKLFPPKTPDNAESSSPGSFTGASALRSVRSLLRRKSSTTSSTTTCESVVPKPIVKTESNIPIRPSRARSRTDPGTFLNPKISQDPPSTPQPGKPKAFVSNIPRPRGKSPGSVRFRGQFTDESDFEYRYDAQKRSTRKLVVANAEVFASSSSSESEAEPLEAAGDVLVAPNHMRGLGFRFSPEVTRKNRDEGFESFMTEVVYEKPKEDEARQSIISYASSDSEYQDEYDDRDNEDPSVDAEGTDQAHLRRKAELMGIVKGLQFPNAGEKKAIYEESDYSGEEGLAISGSTEVIKHDLEDGPVSESEYDEEDDYQDDQRRTPTVLVSAEDDRSSQSPHFPSSRFHTLSKSSIEKRPSESPRIDKYYQDYDSQSYEAVTLAEHSRIAAARERKAFGIPPSESDEVYQTASRGTQEVLSHADSILSAMGSEIWHNDECEELSSGAEALFRTLSGGRSRESFGRKTQQQQPRSSVAEPRKSRSKSTNGGQIEEPLTRQNSSEYGAPQVQHKESEVRRQEILWELRETEATFVHRLTCIVRLFVLPLRVQDSKTWISGVPSGIARLFDWLEDILNLHTQILSALQSMGSDQHLVIEGRVEGLREFVPRLEIYQPYMVRLAEGVELVRALVGDRDSEFGEFVRLQEATSDCKGWTLDRFLVEPVNRIAVYPGVFERLLEATPRTHQDYLPTLCLLRSTDLIIKVMAEVKLREDEYEFVKSITDRIPGLAEIARRDRRLLHQGQVRRIDCDVSSSTQVSESLGDRFQNRSSRLVTAINDWDARRARSDSVKSNASSATGSSIGAASTTSSWDMPASPTPDYSSLDSKGGKKNVSRLQATRFQSRATKNVPPVTSDVLLQLFVFTDLLVVTMPTEPGSWNLCEDVEPSMISLQVLPVTDLAILQSKSVDIVSSSAGIATIHINTEVDERARWLEALERCKNSTLRLMSIPLGLEYDDDRLQRTVVDSLVASGLPIPKSPSLQLVGSEKRQEREERGWWSLRFREVLKDVVGRELS
ncbi:uncharacterized protein EV420DRAFT_1557910 [Desarmillaria tabescens]|uniref:DH domain-containing protein n=1 Tax=Armillaria tabescens TaxID=1929756 RepID=A0AA39N0S8_ARMTA|nr:uncharacterized protein EV420DRAFT_1557910 [Desarmillaria tabescens]KAK0452990.1 hypothetical protein EV420DRAFT_1557910 [Desarmillaria tabescens]